MLPSLSVIGVDGWLCPAAVGGKRWRCLSGGQSLLARETSAAPDARALELWRHLDFASDDEVIAAKWALPASGNVSHDDVVLRAMRLGATVELVHKDRGVRNESVTT